jgi:hypothetical protein
MMGTLCCSSHASVGAVTESMSPHTTSGRRDAAVQNDAVPLSPSRSHERRYEHAHMNTPVASPLAAPSAATRYAVACHTTSSSTLLEAPQFRTTAAVHARELAVGAKTEVDIARVFLQSRWRLSAGASTHRPAVRL